MKLRKKESVKGHSFFISQDYVFFLVINKKIIAMFEHESDGHLAVRWRDRRIDFRTFRSPEAAFRKMANLK